MCQLKVYHITTCVNESFTVLQRETTKGLPYNNMPTIGLPYTNMCQL